MKPTPDQLRRAQLRRLTAPHWLVLLNMIPDPHIRIHCAHLVWWDYLTRDSDKPGVARATPAFYELMHSPYPDVSSREADIRAALLTIGYTETDASRRSMSSNPGPAREKYGTAFRQANNRFKGPRIRRGRRARPVPWSLDLPPRLSALPPTRNRFTGQAGAVDSDRP